MQRRNCNLLNQVWRVSEWLRECLEDQSPSSPSSDDGRLVWGNFFIYSFSLFWLAFLRGCIWWRDRASIVAPDNNRCMGWKKECAGGWKYRESPHQTVVSACLLRGLFWMPDVPCHSARTLLSSTQLIFPFFQQRAPAERACSSVTVCDTEGYRVTQSRGWQHNAGILCQRTINPTVRVCFALQRTKSPVTIATTKMDKGLLTAGFLYHCLWPNVPKTKYSDDQGWTTYYIWKWTKLVLKPRESQAVSSVSTIHYDQHYYPNQYYHNYQYYHQHHFQYYHYHHHSLDHQPDHYDCCDYNQ